MSHERVVELLGSHKVRIARALVRQMRSLSPRYAALEPHALEENLVRLLGLTARFLETGDDSSLKNHTAYTAQLRQALGFKLADFMLATLSFMPVLRRFLIESAPDVAEGLADYEALESVAIPLMANAATLFTDASDDDDDEDITQPNQKRSSLFGSQWSIEKVTGSADEELMPWGRG
jgi:hypothetical protein